MLIVNCLTRVHALKRELKQELLEDISSCGDARCISGACRESVATRITAMLLGLSEKTVASVWERLRKADPAPLALRFVAVAQPRAE